VTKALYPSKGQIILKCVCRSVIGRRVFTTREDGTNSMNNISAQYRNPKILKNARLNALYKHMSKGGNSSGTVEVLDFHFNYYTDTVEIKRVLRYDKRTKKREYWSESRRKSDGKLLGRRKWKLAEEL